uniref:Coiled-coil domain-containing protein 12 n=1 Tax=Caenorhabditis japonica TaxID=281687 RepID=A0A8R1HGH2_CAEJA
MTDKNNSDSEEDIEAIASNETSLELAAKARKRRLLAMKSTIYGIQMEEEDYDQSETSTKKNRENAREFRNHKPDEKVGTEKNALDLDIVQREISEHLKDVLHEKAIDSVDLAMLAPKKIDWDLKRDIESKLQKLERRTQKSVATIIRQRLAEGKGDLVMTVNSATQNL